MQIPAYEFKVNNYFISKYHSQITKYVKQRVKILLTEVLEPIKHTIATKINTDLDVIKTLNSLHFNFIVLMQ